MSEDRLQFDPFDMTGGDSFETKDIMETKTLTLQTNFDEPVHSLPARIASSTDPVIQPKASNKPSLVPIGVSPRGSMLDHPASPSSMFSQAMFPPAVNLNLGNGNGWGTSPFSPTAKDTPASPKFDVPPSFARFHGPLNGSGHSTPTGILSPVRRGSFDVSSMERPIRRSSSQFGFETTPRVGSPLAEKADIFPSNPTMGTHSPRFDQGNSSVPRPNDLMDLLTGLSLEKETTPNHILQLFSPTPYTPPPETRSRSNSTSSGYFQDELSSDTGFYDPADDNSNTDYNGLEPLSTEHPAGEHPSRTLFVRNINSSVEDEELYSTFEHYGPIRSMYTQCKNRGFVMISFYDIRHAKNAMRYLQGKMLKRRRLDIHYSIPRDNPTEKDQNQGTLVVFNLDPSTTYEELKQVFSPFGEIKEIRETPNKKHHKFIEFYDVREAEMAMRHLNKTEIKGKKIKIEPSRPGGIMRPKSTPGMGLDGLSDESAGPGSFAESLSPIGSPGGFSTTLPANGSFSGRMKNTPPPFSPHAHSVPTMPFSPSSVESASPKGSFYGSVFNNTPGSASSPAKHMVGSAPPHTLGSDAPGTNLVGITRAPKEKSESKRMNGDDDKFKYALNLAKVRSGEDTRTTLMIKNIPNKYNQKLLLMSVNEKYRGTYDFIYLPIDFKNKCNVGYAFINFINPESIISFYEEFNNKKWERFNSEKVCEITYARIQGKLNLISHFQNSSLMCEDKKCRPIIFHSEGPNAGEQEPFPIGSAAKKKPTTSLSKEDLSKGF